MVVVHQGKQLCSHAKSGKESEMKKIVLSGALLLTAANLAIGITYAATCEQGGARLCGSTCSKNSSGNCICEGKCTAAEMDWVAGKSGGEEELAQ